MPSFVANSPPRVFTTMAESPVDMVTGLFPWCLTRLRRSELGSFSSSRKASVDSRSCVRSAIRGGAASGDTSQVTTVSSPIPRVRAR